MNTQFDLGAMLSAPVMPNTVQQIPCDKLIPYHNHKFEMYTGERLEDMVASIKENGVLSPIIVQPCDDVYEILIGHNRWNASKLAGLATVPAIVKTGLSEDEAEIYVIESNIIQRGFENLRISEQAAVIALRHNEMFSQGKRNDILRELALLENPNADVESATLTPLGSKLDSGQEVGKEYGVSKGSVIRLIRIDKLVDGLKDLVDSGEIAIRTAVELSFLSENAQLIVVEQAVDFKIDMKKAKALREAADSEGNIDTSVIVRIITGTAEIKPKPKNVKISEDTFSRYFAVGTKSKEVAETVEKALAFYFASMGKENL
jgi:ParB family chromosome partitioning protein